MTISKVAGPNAALVAALLTLIGLGGCSSTTASQTAQPWMSEDVKAAWDAGYRGQGTSITVVDSYNGSRSFGNMQGRTEARTHGSWTALQAGLVAPEAAVSRVDYDASANSAYNLKSGLNIINNSYSIEDSPTVSYNSLDNLEKTTITHARNGTAVVVKAAGNESVAVDDFVAVGKKDIFNRELVGAQSNIFVGALSKNGSVSNPASLAGYSNYAGNNAAIQNNFVVVGVDNAQTGLAGTSFAAPIVSGYAAVLGSKFTSATPTQITNQILNTARKDTIQGYSANVHGRGEASLSRALAPAALQ